MRLLFLSALATAPECALAESAIAMPASREALGYAALGAATVLAGAVLRALRSTPLRHPAG
jgi:hypothetical protein